MHITTQALTDVATTKQFRTEPSWQDMIMQQVTEAMVDGASEVTLDLLYYIHERMVRTAAPGRLCSVKLEEFQAYEAKRRGIPPSVSQEVWSTFDWRHAFENPDM